MLPINLGNWWENAGSSQSATLFFICSWINFKCSSTAIAARGSEWCLSGVSSSLRWSAAWIGATTGRRHHSWPPWTASPESLRRHTTNQWRWRRKHHQEWPNRLSLLSYLPLAKQGSSRKSLRESATWWQVSSWSREAAHQLWNSQWPSDAVLVRGWTPWKWSCCCPPWLPKITELVRTVTGSFGFQSKNCGKHSKKTKQAHSKYMVGWLLFTQMGNVGVWWIEPEIFLWDKFQANFYSTLHLEFVCNYDHGDQIGSQTFYFLWKSIMNRSYENTRTGRTWRQDLFLSNLRTVSVWDLAGVDGRGHWSSSAARRSVESHTPRRGRCGRGTPSKLGTKNWWIRRSRLASGTWPGPLLVRSCLSQTLEPSVRCSEVDKMWRWNHVLTCWLLEIKNLMYNWATFWYLQAHQNSNWQMLCQDATDFGKSIGTKAHCNDKDGVSTMPRVIFWNIKTYQNISGWWFQSLWKTWNSVGMIIPYIMGKKSCSKPPTRYKNC